MFAGSKMRKLENRMDERWRTEERIFTYSSLIKLFNRERRKELDGAQKLRRRQAKQIKELRKDCQYNRGILQNIMYGDKQRLRNALHNRTIMLTFQNVIPIRVIEYFEHANTTRQKALDHLKHKKHEKLEIYTHLKLEKTELQERLDEGIKDENRNSRQIITNRIQTFVVRQNAAAEVCNLYKNMLDLLEKDSYYFDSILQVLHKDCEDQCRCILRAAELNQYAQEELGDIRSNYRWVETIVKTNLKERDRQVRTLRKCAEDLYIKCKFLTRPDSFDYVYRGSITSSDLISLKPRGVHFAVTDRDTKELESLLSKIKDATLAPTFLDVLPRLLNQLKHEETLMAQVARMTEFRNRILNMKHNTELMLACLMHNVTMSTTRFNEEEIRMQKEMKAQNHRLQREKEAIDDYGQMLTTLKIVLMSMHETVTKVKVETVKAAAAEGSSSSTVTLNEEENVEETPSEIEKRLLPTIECDSKVLLRNIGKILGELIEREEITLDEDEIKVAQIKHQNEMLNKRLRVLPEEHDMPLMEDREAEDNTILTRADIKVNSKMLVDHYENMLSAAERAARTVKEVAKRKSSVRIR